MFHKSHTATPGTAHGLHHHHEDSGTKSGLLLLVLLVAQLMVILDITAVNIALPSLASDLASVRLGHQLDDHELLAHLRQPAPLRRPRRRPARTAPDVPDRPRDLHRVLLRVRDGRHCRALFAARAGQGLGAAILSPAALAIIMSAFQGSSGRRPSPPGLRSAAQVLRSASSSVASSPNWPTGG